MKLELRVDYNYEEKQKVGTEIFWKCVEFLLLGYIRLG
jgi:hypothetical protein